MEENYLGEFVSLEPIHSIIGEMIESKESMQGFKENSQNYKIDKKYTQAEKDREYANEFLNSDKVNNPEAWIRGVRRKVQNEKYVIEVDSNITEESELPDSVKNEICIARVIARQEGKIPQELSINNGTVEFDLDEKVK